MFINVPVISKVNLSFLIASLLFAIYYFFAFILVENKRIVKQIYIKELLGLYCDSSDNEHFYVDNLVGMASRARTTNKLSTSIIDYFSDYNENTINAFKKKFGPNSNIFTGAVYFKSERKTF